MLLERVGLLFLACCIHCLVKLISHLDSEQVRVLGPLLVEVGHLLLTVLLFLQLLDQDLLVRLLETLAADLGQPSLKLLLVRVLLADLQVFRVEVLRVDN